MFSQWVKIFIIRCFSTLTYCQVPFRINRNRRKNKKEMAMLISLRMMRLITFIKHPNHFDSFRLSSLALPSIHKP